MHKHRLSLTWSIHVLAKLKFLVWDSSLWHRNRSSLPYFFPISPSTGLMRGFLHESPDLSLIQIKWTFSNHFTSTKHAADLDSYICNQRGYIQGAFQSETKPPLLLKKLSCPPPQENDIANSWKVLEPSLWTDKHQGPAFLLPSTQLLYYFCFDLQDPNLHLKLKMKKKKKKQPTI